MLTSWYTGFHMTRNYSKFAKYYDDLLGIPSKKVKLIHSWIMEYNGEATSILELACGTGAVLQLLKNHYEVSGLDLSKEMLNIAKKKIPNGMFYKKDMTTFALKKKFDVILCIFDSINHLQKFSDWKEVFQHSYNHLNEGGLFIFDVNTLAKFDRLANSPTDFVQTHNEDIIVDTASRVGKGRLEFYTRIFEHRRKNEYALFEERITEAAFEQEKIVRGLKACFNVLAVVDSKGGKPTKESERIYFVCKKQ